MDDAARRAAHDHALQDGDAQMARLRGETDPAERANIAARVTEQQMLANMLNDDAYITPGAVGQFANQRPVRNAAERYQAVIDQLDMMAHQMHEHGGALDAMRRYEIFKYMQRFCDLVEGSGLVRSGDEARLTFFRNWAEYVYRVERTATGSAEAVQGRQLAGSADTARVRLSDQVDLDGELSGVSNRFLLENYRDFQAFADRYSGILREAGLGDPAAATGRPVAAADDAPVPGAVLTLPRLTAEDEAALARPVPERAPAATEAGGTPPTGTLAPLGAEHRPVGNPVADEGAARAIVQRLAAGDATALRDIGVQAPGNFNPRGREWGIGRTREGQVVILQGDAGRVIWDDFLAAGGVPLAHSHPLTAGREMRVPGKTIGELLPATIRDDPDAVHVLPSVADFLFCGRHRLEVHDVHTPYVHLGGGRIGNPVAGAEMPTVTFRIIATTAVGEVPLGRVYRSMLVGADSSGAVFSMGTVYTIDNPNTHQIFSDQPSGMRPLATPPSGPGGSGAGAAQDDGEAGGQ
jgi:hypothetical protein